MVLREHRALSCTRHDASTSLDGWFPLAEVLDRSTEVSDVITTPSNPHVLVLLEVRHDLKCTLVHLVARVVYKALKHLHVVEDLRCELSCGVGKRLHDRASERSGFLGLAWAGAPAPACTYIQLLHASFVYIRAVLLHVIFV